MLQKSRGEDVADLHTQTLYKDTLRPHVRGFRHYAQKGETGMLEPQSEEPVWWVVSPFYIHNIARPASDSTGQTQFCRIRTGIRSGCLIGDPVLPTEQNCCTALSWGKYRKFYERTEDDTNIFISYDACHRGLCLAVQASKPALGVVKP